VKSAGFSGDPLHKQAGVFVNEDGHFLEIAEFGI
jgi:hypothetical protein